MDSIICHVSGSNVTTQDVSDYPCDYPCVLENAREACTEALADLDRVYPAGDPRSRPEYWVGRLGFLMEYLLAATEPPQ